MTCRREEEGNVKNLFKLMAPMARKLLIIGIMVIGFTSPAWPITITIENDGGAYHGTDVGELDMLITQEIINDNSGLGTEIAWINSSLQLDGDDQYENAAKTSNVTYYATNQANVFAFALDSQYAYYIIKNSTYRALLKNRNNFDWAVFYVGSNDGLDSGFNISDGGNWEISHVTGVHEPSSLVLLTLVSAGVGLSRLRMARN